MGFLLTRYKNVARFFISLDLREPEADPGTFRTSPAGRSNHSPPFTSCPTTGDIYGRSVYRRSDPQRLPLRLLPHHRPHPS